jgi:hypothetical protein
MMFAASSRHALNPGLTTPYWQNTGRSNRCGGARVGELPVGQRDALDEHRHAVDIEDHRAPAHTHTVGPPRPHKRGELDVTVGRRRDRLAAK